MVLIIGLGNPGQQFQNTKHNVGFEAVDFFAQKNSFPDFKLEKKSQSMVSEKTMGEEKVILAKPQTFMNESGKAARILVKKEGADKIVIVHDDIDLISGKIKIVKERGSAGHKGVKSIIQNIGNEELIRLRIGIGSENKTKAGEIVLKKFSEEEKEKIKKAIEQTVAALDFFVEKGLEQTMNQYNK